MPKDNPNGSPDILVKAMRQVFRETAEEGGQPAKGSGDGLKENGARRDTERPSSD